MKLTRLTDDNFQDSIKEGLVLVDFWAEWCAPCKQLTPILEEIAESGEIEGLVIGKMDIDDNPNTPTGFGVRSIPTLILFQDGQAVATKAGLVPKGEILDFIRSAI